MLPWDVEVTPAAPIQAASWVNWLQMEQELCGPLAEDYVTCGIIVNAQWRTLDLDDGKEIRIYPDGTQALFEDGDFVSRVKLETGSGTTGEAGWSIVAVSNSTGVTYTPISNSTVNYRFLPGK